MVIRGRSLFINHINGYWSETSLHQTHQWLLEGEVSSLSQLTVMRGESLFINQNNGHLKENTCYNHGEVKTFIQETDI